MQLTNLPAFGQASNASPPSQPSPIALFGLPCTAHVLQNSTMREHVAKLVCDGMLSTYNYKNCIVVVNSGGYLHRMVQSALQKIVLRDNT